MKKIDYIIKFIFWGSPLFFWLGWQFILSHPHNLWVLSLLSTIVLILVSYEFSGRQRGWKFRFSFLSLTLLLNSFYLFISLIALQWIVQLLWLLMLWYLYSYIIVGVKMNKSNDTSEWSLISLYGGLYTTFFAAATLFGFRAFLNLSLWPLLLIFFVIIFINTRSLAYAQAWNNRNYFGFWFFLSLLITELVMMLSLLPLNYLIAAILGALAYYSAINFARLYINNQLTRRKIKNYAWFTFLSLVIILLTARWL